MGSRREDLNEKEGKKKKKNKSSPGIMGECHPFVAKRIAVEGGRIPFLSGFATFLGSHDCSLRVALDLKSLR